MGSKVIFNAKTDNIHSFPVLILYNILLHHNKEKNVIIINRNILKSLNRI